MRSRLLRLGADLALLENVTYCDEGMMMSAFTRLKQKSLAALSFSSLDKIDKSFIILHFYLLLLLFKLWIMSCMHFL